MSKSIVLLAAAMAAGVVSAQTSVASLFLLGFDDQDLVGSVMTADATMTQYFVTCAEGTDSSDCGAGPGVTVTMEPNTYGFNMDGGSGL
ncbi:hypothetical protein F4778DRAFT_752139 [Xylariomycetidae sp. FL2044]|nr:hypothetical protein F4778DRAFT_752139 [Xylariomycetidae sp. FL2044]